MAVNDLKLYVGGNNTDDVLLSALWDTAVVLVDQACGLAVVPQVIKDRAYVLVAAEMFNQKKAPNGISQFASFEDGAAVRVARDPMVAAIPLLRPFVVFGL